MPNTEPSITQLGLVAAAPPHVRHWLAGALFPALLGVSVTGGCGSDRPPTERVTGTVTLDGHPLTLGNVIFEPDHGRTAVGHIRSDGSFTLGTYEEDDGAIAGRHRVMVVAREKAEGPAPGAPGVKRVGKSLIPLAYSDVASSGLTFEVTAGGENVHHIKLSSQGPAPRGAGVRR